MHFHFTSLFYVSVAMRTKSEVVGVLFSQHSGTLRQEGCKFKSSLGNFGDLVTYCFKLKNDAAGCGGPGFNPQH